MKTLQQQAKTIFEKIVNEPTILFYHQSPDPDTLGSLFALFFALKKLNPNLLIATDLEKINKWPNFCKKIFNYEIQKTADFFVNENTNFSKYNAVLLDFFNPSKAENQKVFECKNIFSIDHHFNSNQTPNDFFNQCASACEVVFMFLVLNENIDFNNLDVLNNLTKGILSDTKNLSTPSVDRSNTLATLQTFLDNNENYSISKFLKTKENKDYNEYLATARLEKFVLENVIFKHQAAYVIISNEDIKNNSLSKISGAANILNRLNNIDFAISVHQYHPNMEKPPVWKFSLRSKQLGINQYATFFNGSGHLLAAGFELPESVPIHIVKQICKNIIDNFYNDQIPLKTLDDYEKQKQHFISINKPNF